MAGPHFFGEKWAFVHDDSPTGYDPGAAMLGLRKPLIDTRLENSWVPRVFGGATTGELPDPTTLYRQAGMRPDYLPGRSVFGHIDLLTTPVAPDRMLLADNRRGLEILQGLELHELREFMEIVDAHIRRVHDAQTAQGWRRFFLQLRETGRTPMPGMPSYTMDGFSRVTRDCDEIAKRAPVADVVRIPSLMAMAADVSICLSFNNALVEAAPGRGLAVVPRFHIKALDDEAHEVFRKQKLRPIPVSMPVTSLYGALVHCVTIEERENAPPPVV